MARKVVTGSPHREVGLINPRWLLDHPVHHESHLERRFVMAALACPVVTDIVHQPINVELEEGGKYTPDFFVQYADGDGVYVEVKPQKFVPKHTSRLESAKRALAKQGQRYLVVTDSEIDKDGLGKRAILLMRYARMQLDSFSVKECIRQIETMANKNPTIKDLIEHGLSDAQVWNLVARHELRIPPGIHMEIDTPISVNTKKENCHDQLCAWFGIEAR